METTLIIFQFIAQIFRGFCQFVASHSTADFLTLDALRFPFLPAGGALPPGLQVGFVELGHLKSVHVQLEFSISDRVWRLYQPNMGGKARTIVLNDLIYSLNGCV